MLVDFGVGKSLASVDELTSEGAGVGTVSYMAPEQATGAALADERSDLYAVGVLAYRMLTGHVPFTGAGSIGLVLCKATYDPPSLAEGSGHSWPDEIEAWLGAMLARRAEKRPKSARIALGRWTDVCASIEGRVPRAMPTSTEPDEDTLE